MASITRDWDKLICKIPRETFVLTEYFLYVCLSLLKNFSTQTLKGNKFPSTAVFYFLPLVSLQQPVQEVPSDDLISPDAITPGSCLFRDGPQC